MGSWQASLGLAWHDLNPPQCSRAARVCRVWARARGGTTCGAHGCQLARRCRRWRMTRASSSASSSATGLRLPAQEPGAWLGVQDSMHSACYEAAVPGRRAVVTRRMLMMLVCPLCKRRGPLGWALPAQMQRSADIGRAHASRTVQLRRLARQGRLHWRLTRALCVCTQRAEVIRAYGYEP